MHGFKYQLQAYKVVGSNHRMMLRFMLIIAGLGLVANAAHGAALHIAAPTIAENTKDNRFVQPAPSKERMAVESRAIKAKPLPSLAVMESNGARIGKVIIKVKDIFDEKNPKENKPLFRLVNHLHIITRQDTIANLLLFKSGDKFVAQALTDSERILRNMPFLYDARVRPISYENNTVDVEVITTDVWTLGLDISFSHKGGESHSSFELSDANFLGYGKRVRVQRSSDIDRLERTLEYYDPNLRGTHSELTATFSDNSDGLVKHINLKRPFVSLDSRFSFELNSEYTEQSEKFYELGEPVHEFSHKKRYYDFEIGFSKGLVEGVARRWSIGFKAHSDDFQQNAKSVPGYVIPENRRLNYPWINFEYVENRFIKTRRLNLINRTEDLNLGRQYNVQIGWADKSLNSTSNTLIYEGNYSTTERAESSQLFLLSFGLDGRLTDGRSDLLHWSSSTRYYYPYLPDRVFYSSLNLEYLHDPSGETQLLLGGDNGLRGYPARLQQGNRKVLFTLEERFYTDLHLFQLAYVGGAMFFDIGRAWSGDTPDTPVTGFMKDVGLGLRFTSSRAGKGQVLHMDLAFPLNVNHASNIGSYQYIVSTESSF